MTDPQPKVTPRPAPRIRVWEIEQIREAIPLPVGAAQAQAVQPEVPTGEEDASRDQIPREDQPADAVRGRMEEEAPRGRPQKLILQEEDEALMMVKQTVAAWILRQDWDFVYKNILGQTPLGMEVVQECELRPDAPTGGAEATEGRQSPLELTEEPSRKSGEVETL